MKRLARHIAQFRALSLVERRTLLVAAACMPVFWLGPRVLSLARFQARLQRQPVACCNPMTLQEIQSLGELVNIAARYSLGPRVCLTRSLLLVWLLLRRGVKSQLRIGVRLTQGVLEAHAWVEHNGTPINDRRDVSAQFTSFGDSVPLKAFHTP